MTTPDRQQLIDAWDALDRMSAGDYSLGAYYSDLETIKAILPARPVQTMDEIGWDDQYFLAEADISSGYDEQVVMLDGRNTHGSGTEIVTNAGICDPEELTPTGRKYKLVLDAGHSEYLETLQDYKAAPENTVVIDVASLAPWMKDGGGWDSIIDEGRTSNDMSGTRRRVLRWGRGTDD